MERVNSNSMEKNMAKQKHSKIKGFLNLPREAEIHAIPKAWDEWIPIEHGRSKGKNKHSKIMGY